MNDQSQQPKMRPWPADRIERWGIDRIQPYSRNVMIHSDEQIGKLLVKRGLSAFSELPVVVARGWTEDEKAAYRIADNQLGRLSDFDMPALKAEILELQSTNFNLSLTGFDALDIKQITANPAGNNPDEEVPAPPANPVTRRGDIWIMGAEVKCPKCGKKTPLEKATLHK